MKRVKYIRGYGPSLTKGKVYCVIEERNIHNIGAVLIKNDQDNEQWYYTKTPTGIGKFLFEDATIEYRNEIIEDILK